MPKSMSTEAKRKARLELAKRFGWKCYYCGADLIPDDDWRSYYNWEVINGELSAIDSRTSLSRATVDHIIPLSKGGSNKLLNLVLCCQHCNCSKNANLKWGLK